MERCPYKTSKKWGKLEHKSSSAIGAALNPMIQNFEIKNENKNIVFKRNQWYGLWQNHEHDRNKQLERIQIRNVIIEVCISADNTYPHCNLAPEFLFMLWNIFETVLSKMIVEVYSLARELLRGLNGISRSINFCNMNFPWKSLFSVAVIFYGDTITP